MERNKQSGLVKNRFNIINENNKNGKIFNNLKNEDQMESWWPTFNFDCSNVLKSKL